MRYAPLLLAFSLAACIRPGQIGDPVTFPRTPGITVYFMGTAVAPWPELELALLAADEVGHLGTFELQIFGSNDQMDAPSTPTVTCDETKSPPECATTLGSFEANECAIAGFKCRPVVRVRQLRRTATPIDFRRPKLVRWLGPVLPIDEPDTSTPQHSAAIWDELLCRLYPWRTRAPWSYGAECDGLKAVARARYAELVRAKGGG